MLIVSVQEDNHVSVKFMSSNDIQARDNQYSVCCNVLMTGDLEFHHTCMGRENMSGSWCFWCWASPSQWKKNITGLNWNVDDTKYMSLITYLKGSKRLGIFHQPIFYVIVIQNYVVTHLHTGLGLSNNVLDKF